MNPTNGSSSFAFVESASNRAPPRPHHRSSKGQRRRGRQQDQNSRNQPPSPGPAGRIPPLVEMESTQHAGRDRGRFGGARGVTPATKNAPIIRFVENMHDAHDLGSQDVRLQNMKDTATVRVRNAQHDQHWRGGTHGDMNSDYLASFDTGHQDEYDEEGFRVCEDPQIFERTKQALYGSKIPLQSSCADDEDVNVDEFQQELTAFASGSGFGSSAIDDESAFAPELLSPVVPSFSDWTEWKSIGGPSTSVGGQLEDVVQREHWSPSVIQLFESATRTGFGRDDESVDDDQSFLPNNEERDEESLIETNNERSYRPADVGNLIVGDWPEDPHPGTSSSADLATADFLPASAVQLQLLPSSSVLLPDYSHPPPALVQTWKHPQVEMKKDSSINSFTATSIPHQAECPRPRATTASTDANENHEQKCDFESRLHFESQTPQIFYRRSVFAPPIPPASSSAHPSSHSDTAMGVEATDEAIAHSKSATIDQDFNQGRLPVVPRNSRIVANFPPVGFHPPGFDPVPAYAEQMQEMMKMTKGIRLNMQSRSVGIEEASSAQRDGILVTVAADEKDESEANEGRNGERQATTAFEEDGELEDDCESCATSEASVSSDSSDLADDDVDFEEMRLMYRGNVAHVDDVVRQELKCHVSRVKELKSEAHDCKSAQMSAIKLRIREMNARWKQFVDLAHRHCNNFKLSQTKHVGSRSKLNREWACDVRRYRSGLPIFCKRNEIEREIEAHQVVVIVADTGSGKSTQLPQYLAACLKQGGQILCTQPRKVAAMSLAKYVNQEMLGTALVDYEVSYDRRGGQRARILYVTEAVLLRRLRDNRTLSGVDCVIVDEAHERNVNTDVCLGMLKQCLEKNRTIKVVITSATIDPEPFLRYFHDASLVRIPGRQHPVTIRYRPPSSNRDLRHGYLPRTLDVVLEICREEAAKSRQEDDDICDEQHAGHVLVFLPSPTDTELAERGLNERLLESGHSRSVQILQLHGRQQPDDQQLVFEKCPPEFHHKVIFATNSAQTSITVPGVRFVVDCGLGKVRTFDPRRQSNVLEIVVISKGAAMQRSGRAGRTGPGIAYRLYSRSDYDAMPEEWKPEIQRSNLAQTLLYLLSVGLTYPIAFEFIDPPDPGLFGQAYVMLKSLGAIGMNGLTELGQKMIHLPIEPRLSKMLLEATTTKKCATEMVAVVACMAVGNLFCRFGTDEQKNEADVHKLSFCDDTGDPLTLLRVFDEYRRTPLKRQRSWCGAKFINGRCMRTVVELIKELINALRQHANVDVPSPLFLSKSAQFDFDQMREVFPSLFFGAYGANVARYMGTDQAGYYSLELERSLRIHPSSALRMQDIHPLYIVYEYCLNTQQAFAVNVCAVDEAWIENRLDRTAVEKLEQQRIMHTPIRMGPTGKRRLCQSRDLLKNSISESCRVETLRNDAFFRLAIAHPAHCRQMVEEFIDATTMPAIVDVRSEMREVAVLGTNLRVVMKAGLQVSDVVLDGEYSGVVVGRAGHPMPIEHVRSELAKFGHQFMLAPLGEALRTRTGAGFLARFESVEGAVEVVTRHEGDRDFPVTAWHRASRASGSGGISAIESGFTLRARWWRRRSKRFGFIKFFNSVDAERAHAILQCELPSDCGRPSPMIRRSVETETNWGTANGLDLASSCDSEIHLCDINEDVKGDELETRVAAVLRSHGIRIARAFVVREKSYPPESSEVLEDYANAISRYLECLLAGAPGWQLTERERRLPVTNVERARRQAMEVRLLPPKSEQDIEFIAIVKFASIERGEQAARELARVAGFHDLRISYRPVRFSPEYQMSVLVSKPVLEATRSELLQLDQSIQHPHSPYATIRLGLKLLWHKARILVRGSQKQLVCKMHELVLDLLNGTRLDCRPADVEGAGDGDAARGQFSPLMTGWGERFLGELQQEFKELIITRSVYRSIVQLQGPSESREKAFDAILQFLRHRARTLVVEEVTLRPPHFPAGMMKALLAQHRFRLANLQAELGGADVRLDCKRHLLHFEGSHAGFQRLQAMLARLSSGIATRSPDAMSGSVDCLLPECCVCLGPIEENPYCLDACGHYACLDCVVNQIHVCIRTRQFPVVCASDNCAQPIAWTDIERIVLGGRDREKGNDAQELCAMVDAALAHFMQRNGGRLRFCITADCRAIYRIAPGLFECSICGRTQCSQCGCEQHDGISCKQYVLMRDNADQSLQHWLEADPRNRRLCPNLDCRAAIEKNRGCMHVECIKCNTHFCWQCMQTAPGAREVYAHMSAEHGDIGGGILLDDADAEFFDEEFLEQLMLDDAANQGLDANEVRQLFMMQQAELDLLDFDLMDHVARNHVDLGGGRGDFVIDFRPRNGDA